MIEAMPDRVSYCERSTIVEAWATILGQPAAVEEEEVGAIVSAAKREFGGLTRDPAVVAAKIPRGNVVPPFWSQQWSWDEGNYLARVGHRFLSVHFRASSDAQYQTYEESLRPPLCGWLRAAAATYENQVSKHQADRVVFGYVNTFDFAAEDFDISEHFKYSIGIGIDSAEPGLRQIDLQFAFTDRESNADVTVRIDTGTNHDDPDRIKVTTVVTAQASPIHGHLDDADALEAAASQFKEVAKRIFFEFATARTHKEMGAKYATS